MKKTHFFLALLGLLALLSVGSIVWIQSQKQAGDSVRITQDGQILYELPLDQDQTLCIPCRGGYHPPANQNNPQTANQNNPQTTNQNKAETEGAYNIIEIANGQVSITEASCPDQICVAHAPIRDNLSPIVCLPNRLVVEIVSRETSPLDGVAQ